MMPDLDLAEYKALLREDFCSFLERCFYELHPHGQFLPNWHIEAMAAKLAEVRTGVSRRLIINIPPRHLKSLAASVAFVAWLLGHNPKARIICVSYAQDLADKHARDCRRIMNTRLVWRTLCHPPFVRPPGRRRVRHDRSRVSPLHLGGRHADRTGADIIIIDDPLKPDEALSETQREQVNE